MILKLRGIRKTYPSAKKQVLRGISLKVPEGQILGLAGESGSGKSTLLKIIAGREIASKGKMKFASDEHDILVPNMMQQIHGIRYIDQDSKIPLNLPVRQILEKRLYDYKVGWRNERIRHLVKLCQLKGQLDKRPEELSGGQRQRVALSLAIADEPRLILLDEAFTSLDYSMKHEIQSAWVEVMKKEGITAIMVTHDPKDALMYCDEIAIMFKGKLIQQSVAQTIYHEPRDQYTAELFGQVTAYGDPPKFYRPNELRLEKKDEKGKVEIGHETSDLTIAAQLKNKYFQGDGWLNECIDKDNRVWWVFSNE